MFFNTKKSATDTLTDLSGIDNGLRETTGWQQRLFIITALTWAIFQLWFASPLKFMMDGWLLGLFQWINQTFGTNIYYSIAFGSEKGRIIHLAFAMVLVFLSYPACKTASRNKAPWYDILLLIAGFSSVFYLIIVWNTLTNRTGNPNTTDIILGTIGLLVLIEGTRRSLGLALVIIVALGSLYTFFGDTPLLGMFQPSHINYKSFINHQWVAQSGVFGTPLQVSMSVVFLFVLFGALLDKAGAGGYFIRCAFSSLGHLRGGPAKAAVIASALTGLVSGSSIANTITTGTFTIPMMRKVNFSKEKAGAVEVASSVNGQLMPPVMGAAAFLMEAIIKDLNYQDIIKHAFLPATISYIALVYIVHLEACKQNIRPLQKGYASSTFMQFLIKLLLAIVLVVGGFALSFIIVKFSYILLGGLGSSFLIALLLAIYVGLVYSSSRFPDFHPTNPVVIEEPLPRPLPIFLSGLYYLLPVILLMWNLMINRKSAETSAFWACLFLIIIIFTQRPLLSFFRKLSNKRAEFKASLVDFKISLISASRSMVTIAFATAAAGIIVGIVDQTGVGPKFSYLVEAIAGDSIILILLMTAVLSLILGMGLPTTANYILVSALMVPVVVDLGQANGLLIPLIAAHMFCFYFGIMADVTPPVGLASFAAAAISGGDPLKTGAMAFYYSLRTAILPFLFVFNVKLLLWDVGFWEGVLTAIIATSAILIFTAALQGWLVSKLKIWESLALVLVAFTLFFPRFWLDQVSARFTIYEGAVTIESALGTLPDGTLIRMKTQPKTNASEKMAPLPKYIQFPLASGNAPKRTQTAGFGTYTKGDGLYVDVVSQFVAGTHGDSLAYQQRLEEESAILFMEVPNKRPAAEWFWLPALLLFVFIYWRGRRRLNTRTDAAL